MIDLLVVITYFAVIITIGLRSRPHEGERESVEGYALGNRTISWWAVMASILAAEISAATFLGAPESGFSRGNWSYAQFAIGTILARFLVSRIFVPVFYRHGVISLYELLEERFGPLTRHLASITFMVTRVLAIGTRLYVSAIILVMAYSLSTGTSPSAESKFLLYTGAVVIVTLLTTVYTTLGGIKAVIWTDVVQVGVMFTAIAFTIPFILHGLPEGWMSLRAAMSEPVFFNFSHATEPGALAWAKNLFTSEYTLWAAIVGSMFVTLSTHGIDQDTVQRMLTARNTSQSARATISSGFLELPIMSAFILIGVLLRAHYAAHPVASLPVESREVFPYFIMTEMPQGLRGLLIAGILATAMGSLSTALNALATSLSVDFLIPRLPLDAPESAKVGSLRRATLFFSVLVIGVGIATAWVMVHDPKLEILPVVIGILGYTYGSLLGVFLLAIFTRGRGSDLGNAIAMAAGMASVFILSSGTLSGFTLAFPWRITAGTLVTLAVGACFKSKKEVIL